MIGASRVLGAEPIRKGGGAVIHRACPVNVAECTSSAVGNGWLQEDGTTGRGRRGEHRQNSNDYCGMYG